MTETCCAPAACLSCPCCGSCYDCGCARVCPCHACAFSLSCFSFLCGSSPFCAFCCCCAPCPCWNAPCADASAATTSTGSSMAGPTKAAGWILERWSHCSYGSASMQESRVMKGEAEQVGPGEVPNYGQHDCELMCSCLLGEKPPPHSVLPSKAACMPTSWELSITSAMGWHAVSICQPASRPAPTSASLCTHPVPVAVTVRV